MVTGCKIEFDEVEAIQCPGLLKKQTYFVKESEELDGVIQELLYISIIVELDVVENVFVLPFFSPPKRLISEDDFKFEKVGLNCCLNIKWKSCFTYR